MRRLFPALILALTVACASLSTKQTISAAHLAARNAVTILDDAEMAACKPDVTKKHCTAVPVILTDAAHANFSARIVDFYMKDKAISQLIVDWTPGQPVPVTLTDAIAAAEKFVTDANALAPALTAKADAVLKKWRDLAQKWVGGVK